MEIKKWIISILFNVFETICIFGIGYLIGVNIIDEIIMMMLFCIPRFIFNGASHYKSPLNCFIVSLLLGTCFMLMFNVNSMLGYVTAIFSGCILTNKGNIYNIYQWNMVSKYKLLIDYINDNPDDQIVKEYEEYIMRFYPFRYEVYNLKFKEHLSIDKIMDCMCLNNHKDVVNELNIIYDSLRFSLKLYD